LYYFGTLSAQDRFCYSIPPMDSKDMACKLPLGANLLAKI
jgi:hypothetical protein